MIDSATDAVNTHLKGITMQIEAAKQPLNHHKAVFVNGVAHPRIEPAAVNRNELGYWLHPACSAISANGPGYQAWLSAQTIEVRRCALEDELAEHPVVVSYFDNANENVSGWDPAAPAGEGWFMLSLQDTDTGPVCTWARACSASAEQSAPAIQS